MKAVVIEANGTVRRADLPDYQSLNRTVGGYVELINFGDTGHFAYVNEDGIALGLPYNELATQLCFAHNVGLMDGDYIKGSMVVVGPPDDEGNDGDISELLATYLESYVKTE